MTVEVSRDAAKKPKIATFMGHEIRHLHPAFSPRAADVHPRQLARTARPHRAVADLQREVSQLPQPGRLLIESFPHDGREQTVIYGFAGRNGMQTLGLLLTKRMEELGLHPWVLSPPIMPR